MLNDIDLTKFPRNKMKDISNIRGFLKFLQITQNLLVSFDFGLKN